MTQVVKEPTLGYHPHYDGLLTVECEEHLPDSVRWAV